MSARLAGKLACAFVVPIPALSSSPAKRRLHILPRPILQMWQPPRPISTGPSSTHPIASSPSPPPAASPASDPTVQYIVVRRDLLSTWPTGSVIAQAVHASVAAVWASRATSVTTSYCGQPGNGPDTSASPQMHTVVLEAKNEDALLRLAARLDEAGVRFALWKEQPEDFVTALAAWPYPRDEVKKHFSKFKLFK